MGGLVERQVTNPGRKQITTSPASKRELELGSPSWRGMCQKLKSNDSEREIMKANYQIWIVFAIIGIPGCSCCTFTGLLSSCRMSIGGIHVQASAMINHCHTPIDITFQLQSSLDYNITTKESKASISWKYTYVTSNTPESLEIPGSDRRILLHIFADPKQNEIGAVSVPIQAQFMVDGQTSDGLTFLDETVRIPHFDDCQFLSEDDQIRNIVMGCILSVILLCIFGILLIFMYHKRRRRSDDEVNLVTNPEPVSRNQNPENGTSIHYVVPRSGNDEASDMHELQVYVSTKEGLKKVERKNSSSSSTSSDTQKRNQSDSKSSAASCSSASGENQSPGAVPDRSSGAIPKNSSSTCRQQFDEFKEDVASFASSSGSSFVSR